MEGLIPLVYKAIKRNKIRRQYELLSSGAARTQSYNVSSVSDFYNSNNTKSKLHRRHASVGDMSAATLFADDHHHRSMSSSGFPRQKKLLRFGSQRMFSCVSGV